DLMHIFCAVDLLPDHFAPPCAVIRIVDQVDHGEAPILIPKRGDPGVCEGVADDHRGEGRFLDLHIEEGVRHQLYAEQIGFTEHQERPPISIAWVSSAKGLLHRRIRPNSVRRTPSSAIVSSPSFSKSIYPSMASISSSSAPMRRRTVCPYS